MEHNLLKKEKIDELYNNLFEPGYVECGHESIEEFVNELGELLHHSEQFSKIKHLLKDDLNFRQRFENEIRRIVLETA